MISKRVLRAGRRHTILSYEKFKLDFFNCKFNTKVFSRQRQLDFNQLTADFISKNLQN